MRSDQDYWRQLAYDWTHAEHVGLDEPAWRERFSSGRPGREHLMESDVRDLLAKAPERIRVWRGAVRGVNEDGLSWTID